MRIISAALFAGFVMSLSGPSEAPERRDDAGVIDASLSNSSMVDPVVTGRTITESHKAKWLDERKAYLECPKCVSSQPFPGN